MFIILVLIMMLLQLMKFRHSQVFNEKEWLKINCLDLLKNVFLFCNNDFFSYNVLNVNSLKCVSVINQE